MTPLTRDVFDGATAERRLAAFFGVATTASFGAFSRIELTAAAAAVTYVERTQIGKRPPLSPPVREAAGATLAIDQATRANLELIRTLAGERRGSLLAAIDRTVTAAGSRLLAQRLAAPLTDPAEIAHRLDAVSAFVNDSAMRGDLRGTLKTVPDLARALARIVVGRGGPRDLAAIRDGICAAAEFSTRLSALADVPRDIADAIAALRRPDAAIATELARALADELPAFRRDGGFVRGGYEAALDEARALRDESRRVIAALQVRYAETTGVKTLKIRHNNVLGYFVDVTAQHGEKLLTAPLNGTFIHRQTLAGQVRFTTTELGELEAKIANAADRALALEFEIFDALAARVTAASAAIKQAAEALAAVDAMTALAALAVERNYVRPVVDGSLTFSIEGGRHPVVEQALGADGGPFVANDCDLSPPADATAGRIWLVTGPNMAGKSTFLRQNALIAVLAQMGSFVPARAAHIGVVDRLFSRVGAADDLARGHSTFMVEMVETAAILNQAGERALVILDEIGRGTSTFDGLSIAWATIEHLHESNRCRTLFATHFHEMTALAAKLKRLHNATMRVKEWHGDVVFLHEVVPGAADRSYGIQVAKLAGLPPTVIERAKLVLAQIEAEDRTSPARKLIDDLPLFAAARPRPRRRNATRRSPLWSTRSPRCIPTKCRRATRWKRFTRSRRSWRRRKKIDAQAGRLRARTSHSMTLQPMQTRKPEPISRPHADRRHQIVQARKPSQSPFSAICACAIMLADALPPTRGCRMTIELAHHDREHREHAGGERADAVARRGHDGDHDRGGDRAQRNVVRRAQEFRRRARGAVAPAQRHGDAEHDDIENDRGERRPSRSGARRPRQRTRSQSRCRD